MHLLFRNVLVTGKSLFLHQNHDEVLTGTFLLNTNNRRIHCLLIREDTSHRTVDSCFSLPLFWCQILSFSDPYQICCPVQSLMWITSVAELTEHFYISQLSKCTSFQLGLGCFPIYPLQIYDSFPKQVTLIQYKWYARCFRKSILIVIITPVNKYLPAHPCCCIQSYTAFKRFIEQSIIVKQCKCAGWSLSILLVEALSWFPQSTASMFIIDLAFSP